MFPIPESFSKNPLPSGDDILFTATAPTIVGSVVGTTTNGQPRQGSVGIKRAGELETSWVSRQIAVANEASANLVPAKLSLNTGDSLIVNASGQVIGQRILPTNFGCWPSEPGTLLSNADGSKIVAVCGVNGIWLSEDGQITARKVNTFSTGTANPGAFFAGKFRVYTSKTSSLTSVDGVTWATEVCVNAPTQVFCSAFGGFIYKGVELYGAHDGQLRKTTDGLNFTNHGVAAGASVSDIGNSFTWTGVNWVCRSDDSGPTQVVRYAAEAAASWTTVGLGALGSNAIGKSCIASIGGVVAISGTNSVLVSTDHGVTFPTVISATLAAPSLVAHNGVILVAGLTSESSVEGNGRVIQGAANDGFIGGLDSRSTFATNSSGLINANKRSVDSTVSRRAGFTVTANVLEMQP